MRIIDIILAGLRRLRTSLIVAGKRSFLVHGDHLHIGRSTHLWAPQKITIGDHVYIGKEVHIEANCSIGNFCLIANRVAIIGRHDHDFRAIGHPVRYSPWVASKKFPSKYINEKATIEDDVWIGFGSIILTGTTIGKGSVIAAGSVVTADIPDYSIAAGVPARVVGQRFSDPTSIKDHENAVSSGKFALSELGYDQCVIEPRLLLHP